MPYRSKASTGSERLHLPSNPEYWVEMKHKMTRGDRAIAQDALMRVSDVALNAIPANEMRRVARDPDDAEGTRGMINDYEVKAYFDTCFMRLITAWNLDRSLIDPNYEGDEILPITVEYLDMLDDEDGIFLQKALAKRIRRGRVSDPFDGRSPASSTDTR